MRTITVYLVKVATAPNVFEYIDAEGDLTERNLAYEYPTRGEAEHDISLAIVNGFAAELDLSFHTLH